jgi:hypothetical protein
MPVIPAHRRLRQDYKFKASLGHTVRPYLKTTTKKSKAPLSQMQALRRKVSFFLLDSPFLLLHPPLFSILTASSLLMFSLPQTS